MLWPLPGFLAEPLAADAGAFGLLLTAFLLGLRHGIDWDHIAAITDITSTTGAAEVAEQTHRAEHAARADHDHGHGGHEEIVAHEVAGQEVGVGAVLPSALPTPPTGPWVARPAGPQPAPRIGAAVRERGWQLQRGPILLGTLYALGHALVVAILGGAALLVGTRLPGWLDPLMGRIVGLTLLLLGAWVFVSLYHYARHGAAFRLRSRWMLVFDGLRHVWRRIQARLHGHEHVEPLEMSSYGTRTAFGVGMIHGIGAETGTQVLLIAAIGGAASVGLGIPMMIAFICGLVITNTAIVVLSASGFVASQRRTKIYVVVGVIAGVFSVLVGGAFLLGAEDMLPDLEAVFGG